MSKSIIGVGRNGGEPIAAGVTNGQSLYGEAEGDTNNSSLNVTFSVAGVLRNPAVNLTANTLSGDFTATLYINNSATTCVVTVTSGTGWTENTAVACQVAVGDAVRWVVTSESGTGSASYNKLIVEFEPDTAGDCLTIAGVNNASSTGVSSASTSSYWTPWGKRVASTTEADVGFDVPIAVTAKNFNIATGNNARTTDSTGVVRVNGVDKTPSITITAADDSAGLHDTTNTVALAAEDTLLYKLTTGTGTEVLNIEKMGVNLVNTSDLFFLASGSSGGNAGGSTLYWPIVGSCLSGTESTLEARLPNNCAADVKRLFVYLDVNTNTSDTVVTLRKNGVDTTLVLTCAGSTDGYFSVVPGATLSIAAGDTLTVKSVQSGGSASLTKIAAVGVVLQATGTGGTEPPATEPSFIQTWTQGEVTNVTSSTLTISGATADNLLVGAVCVRAGGDAFTTPTGWTLLQTASDGAFGVASYWRIATGTTADDFACSWTDSGRARLTVQEFDILGHATPADGSDEAAISSVASINCGSVTPTTDRSIAVAVLGTYDRSTWATGNTAAETEIGPPTGYSNDVFNASGSSRPFIGMASKILDSTTAESPTWTTTEAGGLCYATVAVFKVTEAAGGSDVLTADDLQSATQLSTPEVGQEHALLADNLQAASQLSTPAAGQEQALTADDLQTSTQLSTPAASQAHTLTADDLQAATQVSTPAVGQEHVLTADELQANTQLSTPVVGQEHVLTGDDLQSGTQLSTPTAESVYALLADNIQSASQLSSPVLTEDTQNELTADNLQSAAQLSTPAVGQEHILTADDLRSASQLSQPSLAEGGHALLADDLQSAIRLSTPVVGQEHALNANDLNSASQLSTPAVGQEHALTTNNLEISTQLSAPATGQEHVLSADDLQSASQLSTPAAGQEHALLADDIQSASQLSSPALAEGTHALLADDLQSASQLSTPAVGQEHALLADDIQSASQLSAPVLSEGNHLLLADNLQSASQLSTPAVGQEHALLADNTQSASQLSSPVLAEGSHALLADDLQSATQLFTPAIGQEHVLLADDLQSATQISSPTVSEGNHLLLAEDIQSATQLSTPALGQIHLVTGDDLQSGTQVSTPALGQLHLVTADDLQAATQVSSPVLAEDTQDTLLADDIQSSSQLGTPALGQIHLVAADDLQSGTQISTPALGQLHLVNADDLQSATQVNSPALSESTEHALTADDLQSATQVSTPVMVGDIQAGPFPNAGYLLSLEGVGYEVLLNGEGAVTVASKAGYLLDLGEGYLYG